MDRLIGNFTFNVIPDQFLYISNRYISLYVREGKGFKRAEVYENYDFLSLSKEDFRKIKETVKNSYIGIILNPAFYIFNILDFERLPLKKKSCNELVDWRLKKIFPENLDNYIHTYFKFHRKSIFSILLKAEIYRKIDSLLSNQVIFFGSSTLIAMNKVLRRDWSRMFKSTDMMIEIDQNTVVVVVQNRGAPYYIRKFKLKDISVLAEEITKVLDFLKGNYSKNVESFCIVNHNPDLNSNDFNSIFEMNLRGGFSYFTTFLERIK